MSLFLTCRRKPGQKSDFQVGSLSHQWWVHPQAIGTARLRLYWPERKFTNATASAASVTQEFSTTSQGRLPSLTADFRVQSDSSPALCGWCFVFLDTTKTPLSAPGLWECLPGVNGRRVCNCILLSASPRPQGTVECCPRKETC